MSDIFRKVALERLSSPEQLDQLLEVTRPAHWLALSALGLVVAAALMWGFLGSVPTEAQGEGILLRHGGVADLVATGSGQVEEVLVAVGDRIEKGQEVARIRQEGLSRQLEETRARKAALEGDYQRLLGYAGEQQRLSSANLEQQRGDLNRTIATLEREVELAAQRVTADQALLADGLITQQTLLDAERDLNTLKDRLAAQRLELAGLGLKRLESERGLNREIEDRRNQIRDQELKLRELEASLSESVKVISPHTGRVVELAVDRGDVVSPGAPILSVEIQSEELVAVLYVPAEQGKLIKAGSRVRVSPSSVRQEEHGFLLGEVRWVAEYPSTARGMLRLLGNQELVNRLVEKGPAIEVDVALEVDPATPTGFRWTSSPGPRVPITSGTLAKGRVLLREDRPISLVIPSLRSALGL